MSAITRRRLLGSAAAIGAMQAWAARAFGPLHFGGAGGTGGGSSPHFVSVGLSSQSVVSGNTFHANIIITKSDSSAYTGTTPTLGGANASSFTVGGSAPNFTISSNAPLGTGSDSGVYDITISVFESDCVPSSYTSPTLAIAWTTTIITLGNGNDMTAVTLNGTTNTLSTVQGAPTREIGWVFAPGQVPVGSVPVFTDVATGHVLPYSSRPINAKRFWPAVGSISGSAGSLMHDTFMFRLDNFSIPPGGTRAIQVSVASGSYPSGGARTVAEIYAQNFVINCPPSGLGSGYDPSVQYSAFISSSNASNLLNLRHWVTGDAGDVWCFTYAMSQTAGGTPHPNLVCNVYVESLTYWNGTSTVFGGFRFSAHLRSPYYDVDSIAKVIRWFAPPLSTAPSTGVNYEVNGTYHSPPNWPDAFTNGLTFTVVPSPQNTAIWSGQVCNGTPGSAGTTLIFDNVPVGGNGGQPSVGSEVVASGIPSGTIITGPAVTTFTGRLDNGTPGQAGNILTFESTLGGAGVIELSGNTMLSGSGVWTGGTTVFTGNSNLLNSSGVVGMQVTVNVPYGMCPSGTVFTTTQNTGGVYFARTWTVSNSALVVDGSNNITYYGLLAQFDAGDSTPFYSGGGSFNITPAFMSGGSLPPGFGAGFQWINVQSFLGAGFDSTSYFFLSYNSVGSGQATPTGNGSGTLTVPFIIMPFTRMRIETEDCEMIFVQGTGTMASDVPAYSALVDKYAWVKSAVIPPFATALTGQYQSTSGAIADYSFTYPQNPYSHGDTDGVAGSTGNPPYLNPIQDYDMQEFWNGSPGSLRGSICRTATASMRGRDIKSAVNVDAVPNIMNASYTGMSSPTAATPASQIACNGSNGTWTLGTYTSPPTPLGPGVSGGTITSVGLGTQGSEDHVGNSSGYTFRRTGRLDHLDCLLDQTSSVLVITGRNPLLAGTQFYGADNGCQGQVNNQYRATSWTWRNLVEAFLLYPNDPSGMNNPGNVAFDGTQQPQFWIDRVTSTTGVGWANANAGTNGIIPAGPAATFFQTIKPYLQFDPTASTNFQVFSNANEWEISFAFNSVAFSALHGIANAVSLAEYWAAHQAYMGATFGFYNYSAIQCWYSIPGQTAPGQGGSASIASLITANDQWMSALNDTGADNVFNWTNSSPAFSWAASGLNNEWEGWANGDLILFPDFPDNYTSNLPGGGGYSYNTVYQMANVSTQNSPVPITFDLVPLGGGSPIIPTDTGNTNGVCFTAPASVARPLEFSGLTFGFDYERIFFQDHCHIKSVLTLLGLYTNQCESLLTDALNRDINGPDGSGTGYMLIGNNGPNGSWSDVRYAYQQTAG